MTCGAGNVTKRVYVDGRIVYLISWRQMKGLKCLQKLRSEKHL
ncbi:hypothetical protein ROSEINA2194_02178 [Roseburia inulinivorans DSM 16841]|uniref:Uncharacterized protein n=1 Tax=Roseburia inulinivorans DSM 16841 TaxID=622312 RepID=C0FTV7_9FIRM|nr:hypothetical protein ROSEINA2194_02178 [Roseburia inulinivorans DSM 16841]